MNRSRSPRSTCGTESIQSEEPFRPSAALNAELGSLKTALSTRDGDTVRNISLRSVDEGCQECLLVRRLPLAAARLTGLDDGDQ